MKIKYGTSGNPPNFFKSEYGKDRMNAPEWINSIGLNSYERLMTYGARMKEEDALTFGKKAKKFDVQLSVHGPYYVVLTSEKQRVIKNSIKELIKTLHLSDIMGSKKVILHPGFGKDINKFIKNMKIVEKDKPKNVFVYPETMGKKSQLGSVDEVITICESTECLPCIDFGHVHARDGGSLMRKQDFREILEEIEKRLGKKILKNLHCHFYPVEFNEKGERKHRAVIEKNVFPVFPPFGELIDEFGMYPTLISESRDSQDIGALQMQKTMNFIQK
ncbi:TIM barrel protein [Candidatus Woesearchaeota archaeon]|nr:TIM barrel protein [Candidatus Woesearchaeota archaeon]